MNKKNSCSILPEVLKIFFFSFFLLFGSAHANDISKGLHYYDINDYRKAYQYFIQPSARNNAEVQRRLGYMYSSGSGVGKDYSKAMEWYAKSAAQGNAHAQFDMGTLYEHGEGVKQNYEKAFQWYKYAAEKGYAPAPI